MPRTRIVPLVVVVVLVRASAAQPVQRFPPETPNRHNILSASSPITATLSTPRFAASATSLHSLVRAISHAIDTRIASNHPSACNLRASPWIKSQLRDFEVRQLGALDRTCSSALSATQGGVPDTARETLRASAGALGAAAAAFAEAGALDWRAGHAVTGWDFSKRGQRCTLETATAYRVHSRWYVRAVATNHPVDAFQPDWQRVYVEEFVPADVGPALHAVHPAYPDGGLVNGTTLLIRQAGKAGFSTVAMGDAENPALVEALRLNELAVDQAEDAITPSNIAILALPMVMSLIPVAFVAELDTCATLLYIAFTDIFSVLPFLIKGVELTSAGVINRGEMVGYHVGTPQLGVLEVFAAQCHGQDSFRDIGIAFVVVAIAAMALGLALELFAWKWMLRKGRRACDGPFGEVLGLRVNQYTVLERTVDAFDGEDIVKAGSKRWHIRRKWHHHHVDDDEELEY